MTKNEFSINKFWFKGRVFFLSVLILILGSVSQVHSQLNQTLFLVESPLNSSFYPVNSSVYFDFSSTITFDSDGYGFQQYQANMQYNLSKYSSAIHFSFINQHHYLIYQQYLSLGYIYSLKIDKLSAIDFYSSINFSRQSFNYSVLVFPSELENNAQVYLNYSSLIVPTNFFAYNLGTKIKIRQFQVKAVWRNLAILDYKAGFLNKIPEYYFEVNYRIDNNQQLLSYKFAFQPIVGINKYHESVFYFTGLRVLQSRYFGEIRANFIQIEPRSVSFSVGISIGNTIFAYQNTSILMGRYSTNLNYNGIKIAYEFKKYQKRQGQHAISCPQF